MVRSLFQYFRLSERFRSYLTLSRLVGVSYVTAFFMGVIAVTTLTIWKDFNDAWVFVSFGWRDLPALPEIVRPKHSIFYGHYFGDFTQIVSMNRLPTPYVSIDGFPPSQYSPFAHAILLPFGLVELSMGWVLWAISSIGILTLGVIKSAVQELQTKTLFFVFASLPVISAIDRGNVVLLAFAAVLFGIAESDKRNNQSLWALAVAISLKPYLIIFAFLLDRRRLSVRPLFSLAIRIGALNIPALFLFQGDVIDNLRGMMHAVFLAGGVEIGVTNHSLVALLPPSVTAAAFVTGFALTIMCLAGSSRSSESERLIFATLAVLAFSPQLPLYQMIFALLLPMAAFEVLRGSESISARVRTSACLVFMFLLVPKQFAVGGFSIACLDGGACLLGWIMMFAEYVRRFQRTRYLCPTD